MGLSPTSVLNIEKRTSSDVAGLLEEKMWIKGVFGKERIHALHFQLETSWFEQRDKCLYSEELLYEVYRGFLL